MIFESFLWFLYQVLNDIYLPMFQYLLSIFGFRNCCFNRFRRCRLFLSNRRLGCCFFLLRCFGSCSFYFLLNRFSLLLATILLLLLITYLRITTILSCSKYATTSQKKSAIKHFLYSSNISLILLINIKTAEENKMPTPVPFYSILLGIIFEFEAYLSLFLQMFTIQNMCFYSTHDPFGSNCNTFLIWLRGHTSR